MMKTKENEITEKYIRLLEKSIIEQPDNWLWSHKRWKSSSQRTVLVLNDGKAGHLNQVLAVAEMVKEVFTIEIVKPLYVRAEKTLKELGYKNVHTRYGDGYKGWPEEAPFDAIIITAAPPEVPQELVDQLKDGGKMVLPVGKGYQRLYLITRKGAGVLEKALIPVRFVPMVKGSTVNSDQ